MSSGTRYKRQCGQKRLISTAANACGFPRRCCRAQDMTAEWGSQVAPATLKDLHGGGVSRGFAHPDLDLRQFFVARANWVSLYDPKCKTLPLLHQPLCYVFPGREPAQPRQREPPYHDRSTLIWFEPIERSPHSRRSALGMDLRTVSSPNLQAVRLFAVWCTPSSKPVVLLFWLPRAIAVAPP